MTQLTLYPIYVLSAIPSPVDMVYSPVIYQEEPMSRPKITHTPEMIRRRKAVEALENRVSKLEETYKKTLEWAERHQITSLQGQSHPGHQ